MTSISNVPAAPGPPVQIKDIRCITLMRVHIHQSADRNTPAVLLLRVCPRKCGEGHCRQVPEYALTGADIIQKKGKKLSLRVDPQL